MSEALVYIVIAVVAGGLGQVLLKKGMTVIGPLTLGPSELVSVLLSIATNPYVILGLTIYVGGTVFWLTALSRVELSLYGLSLLKLMPIGVRFSMTFWSSA